MRSALEHLRIAMEHARQGRVDDALAAIDEGRRTATTQRDLALLARNAGLLCAQSKRHREALGHFQAAASAEPDDAYTEWAIGDAHAALGERDEAEAHWQRFAELAAASDDPALLDMLEKHRARGS